MSEHKDLLPEKTPHSRVIHQFLNFILKENYFSFINNFYLQINGTSMGTKCAPPYSGIFMHYLESNLKKGFESCILLWLRYIDDMFILFRGSLKKLNAFIEHANTFHNSIKFTFEYSKTTVNFLDVQVTKDKYHKLQTSI